MKSTIEYTNNKITSNMQQRLELEQLKKFLLTSGEYYRDIKNGETYVNIADSIMFDMLHELPYQVDMDALAYAYYKLQTEQKINLEPYDAEITERIQRMRNR